MSRKTRNKRSHTPGLESLEPRILMTTYNVPGTIDYSGATDVTAAIQSYIDSVPNGTVGNVNTILFQQNGIYRADHGLTVSGRSYLTLDGNGSTFNTDRPLVGDYQNAADYTFDGTEGTGWNGKWTWEGLATTRTINANTGKVAATGAGNGVAYIN